jgi:hypothetical protein
MPTTETFVTLFLALDPVSWRADDKAGWAYTLISAVEAAAPSLFQVESYEMRDTTIYVHLRTDVPPARLRKLLRDDDALIRLRARLADLGARAEFEIES